MQPRSWLARGASLLGLTLVVLLVVASTRSQNESPAPPAPASRAMPPATNLKVQIATLPEKASTLLDPTSSAWEQAVPTQIALSRTPRLFQTENPEPPPRPSAEVRAVQTDVALVLRLRWSDASPDAPRAPAARTDAQGQPNPIYKRPTTATDTFADAAAVMVPEAWTGPEFPSLLMGDQQSPAVLYYWNAARGAEIVRATGRETTSRTGRPISHLARHADGHWTLTLALPSLPAGYPLAFALWDGQVGDRDGIKFFSIWYVLAADEPRAEVQ